MPSAPAHGAPGDDGLASVTVMTLSGTAGVGKTTLARPLGAPGRRPLPGRPALRRPARVRRHRSGGDARRGGPRFPGGPRGAARTDPHPPARAGRPLPQPARRPPDAGGAGQRPRRRPVRPLLLGSPSCLVLVTSRNRLAGLSPPRAPGRSPSTCSAPPRPGNCWPAGSARTGLAAEPAGGGRDHRAVRAAAAGAGRARRRGPRRSPTSRWPPSPPSCGRRRDRSTRFDGGDAGTDVQAVFSWSYRSLTPAAARLFRLLGCHPGPGHRGRRGGQPGRAAAAARCPGCWPSWPARTCVTEHAPGRFGAARPAPGVRGRAGRRPRHRRGPAGRDPARCWTTTCTPRTRRRCCCNRAGTRSTLAAARAGCRARGARPTSGRRWPGSPSSIRCCSAAVAHARRAGFDGHAWQLAWTLVGLPATAGGTGRTWPSRSGPRWPAARRARRPAGQANAHRDLGPGAAPGWAGSTRRARHYRQAPGPLRASWVTTPGRRAPTGRSAAVLDRLGRHAEALEQRERALALYRAAGHVPGRPAPSTRSAGRTPSSASTSRRSRTAGRRWRLLRDDRRPARRGEHLGQPRLHPRTASADHRQAIRCFQRALGAVPASSATATTRRTPCPGSARAGRRRGTGRRRADLAAGPGHPRRSRPPGRRAGA